MFKDEIYFYCWSMCVATAYADVIEPASSNFMKNGDFVENSIGSGEYIISKTLMARNDYIQCWTENHLTR